MVKDPDTNTLKPFEFDKMYQWVPELKKFEFKVEYLSFAPPVDSSMMDPSIWIKLAVLIEENYHNYEGFVILHGTDTMAYTASALSFLMHNLNKPVILTGSQLPMGAIRTDGKENLLTALQIASAQKNGQALVPEVCIYFQDKLFREIVPPSTMRNIFILSGRTITRPWLRWASTSSTTTLTSATAAMRDIFM